MNTDQWGGLSLVLFFLAMAMIPVGIIAGGIWLIFKIIG